MTATNARLNNPYIAGRALSQRTGFFGRDDILRLVETELRSPDRNVIVLFGQRRIGKTSILLQLERELPNPPFVAVHVDLMDRARQPLGRVLHDIAAALADELDMDIAEPEAFDNDGRYFQQQFLPELYRQLGSERRAVLLFDEFDVLDVGDEERLPDTAAARAFFPYLRQLMEAPQLGFVVVVGRRAEDLSIDIKATFKAARYKRVSVLAAEDAYALIRLAEQQGSLRFADGAVERIFALTAGHPYLTQLFCQTLWDNAHASRPVTTPTIDLPTVEATVAQMLEAGQHAFVWIWDGLPPAERVIFAAIAEATQEGSLISEDDLIALLQSRGIRMLVRELELAPKTLVDWEMLRAVDGGYAFTVELLRRWVAENKPLPRVKDELDRVVPFAETLYRGGEGWYRQRKLAEATSQLRQALAINPNHLKARLLLGQVLLEQDQLDAAIVELQQAYQYDEDGARYQLVRVLLEKGQRLERDKQQDAALELYEQVLTLSPREKVAHERHNIIWIVRGDKAFGVGDFDAAISAYAKAGAQDKIDQVTQLKRRQQYEQMTQVAQQHEQREEWTQARGVYQRLMEEFPNETAFQEGLQRVQTESDLSGRYAEGLGFFEQGNWAKAQRALADVIYTRPDYKDAAKLLAQAVNSTRDQQIEQELLSALMRRLPDRVWPSQQPVPVTRIASSRNAKIAQLNRSQSRLMLLGAFIALVSIGTISFLGGGFWGVGAPAKPTTIAWYEPDASSTPVPSPSTTPTIFPGPSITPTILLLTTSFTGHENFVLSVAFSPDGRFALSGSCADLRRENICLQGDMRLWDVATRNQLRTFEGHTDWIRSVVFSPNGRLALSGSDDGTLRLWDVETGAQVRTFEGYENDINSVAFSPDGRLALSGSADSTVQLWDVETGTQVRKFVGHESDVWSVAFSPDGQLALSGSADSTLRLWDVETGEQLRTFAGHESDVWSVAFSPDGQLALSGSLDGILRLWDVATGELLRSFVGHSDWIRSVAFSPDGQFALSGSNDHTLRLWNIVTGDAVRVFEGHINNVRSVTFSPDGQLALSGSDDATLRLWDLWEMHTEE